ncbi:glutamate--tRNA ligase [Acholeplasma laidlawii]|uniref:Glutamate--tRNA ligase n=2 Tax=Acholeplasma laidlawii TaxID=2148 RepID=SYE_ACHLI|nr:glutamate--tRNA ligase [Acholeplasma laidlawii]A9NEI5.1 RecName: Full=Glutamate--tRNA ligase; AltName: Full=Glutamyl-tRNA synthetase; Short=GluRS [Acholeplasma laidlawii PG-8A]ABX80765.1 glutamyl-tRNA synthetase [Acholeplasma laidlawii PG-8A]NWH12060.1 glutamate--tRNA ligase [Acholeplasma laidlawii]NWH12531.1 glutamate--tRNA ligase [Acholeplasma laidlawii]NWH14836.1 glutamate--tRNA ligase [Acholeplasma laidlawii]OAN19372.1 glutamate--tRNA ligase [Acholeplasma laidlawii]
MKKFRARYAPSPTGHLHIGNARTALFNYLFARHHGGDFIIRIEDTDVARNVEGGITSQLNNLKWLGMDWDEGVDVGGSFGPYNQLSRLELYKKYAFELLEKGYAYKDFKEGSEDFAIRFKVPENVLYEFDDVIRGTLKFESKDVEDWIILKDNGIPTYNFAVVIDDHYMEITHVFRGEEHITNTPKQLMVYDALGWEYPTFGHMTIIVNEDRKKLSKRDTNTIQFIEDYKNLGFLPEAMLNFLSLLGWSPKDDEEILSKEELISLFDEHRLSAAPSYFDKQKLAYINSRYLKALSMDELKDLTRPFLINHGIEIKNEAWLESLLSILKDRLSYGAEITKYYDQFFHHDFVLEPAVLEEIKEFDNEVVIKGFMGAISSVDFTDDVAINQALKDTGKALNIKGKPLFMPIRIATTGEAHGPSLPVSLSLLGKELVIKRMNKTLEVLKGETK